MISLLLHPDFSDCRRLFLRDYLVQINIGVYEFEKKNKQHVLINIDLFIPIASSTPHTDHIDEVVDYNFILNTIEKRTASTHIHLQETLCDDLAKTLLDHRKVRAVRVSSEKLNAYNDCRSVGVEVFLIK